MLAQPSLYYEGESGCAVADFKLLGIIRVSAMVEVCKRRRFIAHSVNVLAFNKSTPTVLCNIRLGIGATE